MRPSEMGNLIKVAERKLLERGPLTTLKDDPTFLKLKENNELLISKINEQNKVLDKLKEINRVRMEELRELKRFIKRVEEA